MIYLKNNTETQTIYIPRQTVLGGGYITTTKTYEDGYRDGLEDGKEQQKDKLLNLYVTSNGQFKRKDGWDVVTVDVPDDCSGAYDRGYEDGYNQGQAECPEGGSCTLGEGNFSFKTSDIGRHELNASDDGYDGWSKIYLKIEENEPIPPQNGWGMVGYFNSWGGTPDIPFEENGELEGRPYKVIRGFEAVQGEFKIRLNNAWDNSYTADFYNEPQFAKLVKGDINMSINDGVWDIYLFFGDNGEPNEMLLLHSGTDLSTIQYEYTLNVSVDKENAIIEIGDGFDDFSAKRYYGGSATVPMKYGCTYNINIFMEGYKDIFDETTCYNDEGRSYTLAKIEGGSCPELTTIDITENGSYEGAFNIVNVNVPQEGSSCNLEDKWVTPSMADRDGNNLIVVEESEGYDGLSRVVIDPQTIYNEGVEAGRAEGGEGGSCNLINPIVFSKDAGNTINAENVQIPTFVYEGNQYYNVDSFNLADIEEFKIHILFKPNNSGDAEPVNVFGCENADWEDTTFGARIYQGQITFRMSGQDVVSPYTENTWYDVEMGYNTTKRWVIVNGETLLDAEYASFNKPRQTLMIGAINSGGNAFRPFYGKIAAIYIESNRNQVWLLPKEDGAMYVYWNNRINSRNSISGDNNARFENDFISGDGMKSITWLGNLEDKWVTPSMSERDDNGYIVVSPSEGYNGLERTVINPQTIYNEGLEAGRAECVCPSVQDEALQYDTIAFSYTVDTWHKHNINRNNMTNDCNKRPIDCLLFRNRSGECTVMTKLDDCSGTARLENGWSGDSIILSLKSNSITKFSSNSINSNRLTSIDTGRAQLEGNAITNCNALTDIKLAILNNNLNAQFATNCFNGLPAEGTITIGKNVDVTITDDEITSFFRTIVGEGWTITIK